MAKAQTWQAKLEKRLNDLWYKNTSLPWIEFAALKVLSQTYKTLRNATGQTLKTQTSKKPCTPPIVVVGNLIAGGAGKTPIVLGICKYLTSINKKVGIVSRGYGRKRQEVIVASPGDTLIPASEIGDEPLWLLQQSNCPIAVASDRQAAVTALLQHYPDLDLIVSDDGLQHHRLQRSHEWVVFDDRAAGNKKLLPAGPLREELTRLNSVDWVIGNNIDIARLEEKLSIPSMPNWVEVKVEVTGFKNMQSGRLLDASDAKTQWEHKSKLAFTGLGNPNKFFNSLQALHLGEVDTMELPDHFDYPDTFCSQMHHDLLIVTGKDAVKLPTNNPKLWVAQISTTLPAALTNALEEYIGFSTH